MTDGLIVGIHDSDRGLCLSGRESLLSQERPKWFVFGKKILSLGAAGAVTRVVSFCERYELKIDYVAMDQVCTWSRYKVDIRDHVHFKSSYLF